MPCICHGYEAYQNGLIQIESPTGVSAAIRIGSDFTFYCNTHAVAHIGSNGFITFSSNSAQGATSQLVPNSALTNDPVAAGWHDLFPGLGIFGAIFLLKP
ncbi:MAG: hypothetical protein RLZZ165_2394 [Bacteroidota bacterium]|jgi:hypothetical protein